MENRLVSWLIIAIVLFCFVLIKPAAAIVLLTNDEALKEMFSDADNVTAESIVLDAAQLDKVKSQLGGKWVLYQAGSKSKDVGEENQCTFYFAEKDGEKTGVALMETQPGKWGPVKYIIAMDMTGKISNLAVMMYVEKRGRPIARRRFLSQFIGKTSKDPIKCGKDVDAISGATISSRASCFAVKKAIAIYDVVYLDK